MSRFHVLGGGSLGTLFASHFAKAGVPTSLLLRKANLPRVNLRITAEGRSPELQCRVDCEASSSSDGTPIDNLIVAVKAFDVKAAIDGVSSRLHEKSEIILLCNGALAVADPFDRKGTPILVATTTHGVWSRGKQDVHHAGRGDTWIGQLGGGDDGRIPTAAQQLFASHGLGAIIEDAPTTERRLWLKLAANAVLNPLTALWDVQNGVVLEREEGRTTAKAVCEEIGALAAALTTGAPPPTASELEAFVHECASANAQNYSSMCMDVRNFRRTEIEELNGWIVRKGKELGLPSAAANEELAEKVRERDATRIERKQVEDINSAISELVRIDRPYYGDGDRV